MPPTSRLVRGEFFLIKNFFGKTFQKRLTKENWFAIIRVKKGGGAVVDDFLGDLVMKLVAYLTLMNWLPDLLKATEPKKRKSPKKKRNRKRKR